MNSWDLFDTLVACREGGPAGEHVESLFPIAETIARVKQDDLIVSDYYTYEAAEKVLRQVTGLSNKLVVSQHGKFEGVIWPMLPKIDRHHGDNPTGDYEQPMKFGIPSELINLTQLTELERSMVDFGIPSLGMACREARLRTWHPKFRALQLLQVSANFPVLMMAGMALHRFVEKRKIKRVLMTARDCCLWVDLQKDLCNRLHGKYEVEYFPSSRVCRLTPSVRYMSELNSRLAERAVLVDVGGTGESMATLIEKSDYPRTPGFLIGKYFWRYDERVKLNNIHALTQYFNGGILEFTNTAKHGMYLDWDKMTEIDFDWNREEICVMHDAFQDARRIMRLYPLPEYRLDWLNCLLGFMTKPIVWGGTVNDKGDLSFLSKSFIDEEIVRESYAVNKSL